MADESQLDRIERMLSRQLGDVHERMAGIETQFARLNGTVGEHDDQLIVIRQQMFGHDGHGGLVADVAELDTRIDDVSRASTGLTQDQVTKRHTWMLVITGATVIVMALGVIVAVWGVVA